MGKSLRKIKREREKASSPFHPEVMKAWNRGFEAGAKQQRHWRKSNDLHPTPSENAQ